MTPERKQKFESVLASRQYNLTVVLDGVEDPRNITAVMRSCESVGIQDIFVIQAKQPRHKSYSYKSGRSASKWLTVHEFDDVASCFATLRKRFNKIYTTHLGDSAKSVFEMDFTDSIALVFGSELNGVSEDALQLADGNFMIPQVGFIQSLNISVACAVTIYEAYRQKLIAGHYAQNSLPFEQSEQLLQAWIDRDLRF